MQARGISAGVTRDGVVHRKMTLLPEIDAKFETLDERVPEPAQQTHLQRRRPGRAERPAGDRAGPARRVREPDRWGRPERGQSRRLAGRHRRCWSRSDSRPRRRHRVRLHRGLRSADLDAGGGAVHLRGWATACGDRPGWHDQRDRHQDRLFNATQRRAISLRDGGCIIPGCSIPAAWSEIHHVKEHQTGGETETCNGVLLCWFHHHSDRDERLADPDDQRGPICETAAVAPRRALRRRHPLATIDEVPHPTSRPPPPDSQLLVE